MRAKARRATGRRRLRGTPRAASARHGPSPLRRRCRRSGCPRRSDVATDNPSRRRRSGATGSSRASPLADYAALPRRAGDVPGPVGPAGPPRRRGRPSYEELVETDGRPRLRFWLDRLKTESLLEAAVVYGYFPCVSEGDDLVVLRPRPDRPSPSGPGSRSRASAATGTCAWRLLPARGRPARSTSSAFTVVTMGQPDREADRRAVRQGRLPRLPRAARPVGAAHRGAGRVLARAGARGARLRAPRTTPRSTRIFRQGYRGSRYSFGYPACPDLEDQAKVFELLRPGPDRRRAVRGVPAAPRAVHVGDHRAPPRGEVLQRPMTPREAAACRRCCSTWTGCWSTPSRCGSAPRRQRRPGARGRPGPSRTRRTSLGSNLEFAAEYMLRSPAATRPQGVAVRLKDADDRPAAPRRVRLPPRSFGAARLRACGGSSHRPWSRRRYVSTSTWSSPRSRSDGFDVIVTGDDVTQEEAPPAAVPAGVGRLVADAAHCVVLEDSPAGVRSGESAGAR